MAEIAVIVPVYQVEPYLHRCVDSILNQTFSDFELILVDDGSPDNCGAICDEYGKMDNRVIVIHQENGGLSAARNAGIDWAFANSQSEWFTFIDSDDWVHRVYLDRLYMAVCNTDTKLAMCDYLRTANLVQEHAILPKTVTPVLLNRGDSLLRNGTNSSVACAKLFHKELFAEQRFPVGRFHEDEYVTYRLLYAAGQVAVLKEKLYFYFSAPGSITNSAMTVKRLIDRVDAMEERVCFFESHGEAELAENAQKAGLVYHAAGIIQLKAAGSKEFIPEKYIMREWNAYRILYKYGTNDYFCWHLSMLHPKWEKPHMYLRKIKKMLGITCP